MKIYDEAIVHLGLPIDVILALQSEMLIPKEIVFDIVMDESILWPSSRLVIGVQYSVLMCTNGHFIMSL